MPARPALPQPRPRALGVRRSVAGGSERMAAGRGSAAVFQHRPGVHEYRAVGAPADRRGRRVCIVVGRLLPACGQNFAATRRRRGARGHRLGLLPGEPASRNFRGFAAGRFVPQLERDPDRGAAAQSPHRQFAARAGASAPAVCRGVDGDGALRRGKAPRRAEHAGAFQCKSGDFQFCRPGNSTDALACARARAERRAHAGRRAFPASRTSRRARLPSSPSA